MELPPDVIVTLATAGADQIKMVFTRLVEPFCKEVGESWGDWARKSRFERQIKTLLLAKERLERAGLSPKSVNLKILVPLLENAALEDSDEMTERWAALLAKAANPNRKLGHESAFVEILRQLTPLDAQALDRFYSLLFRYAPNAEWKDYGVYNHELRDGLKCEPQELSIAIDNLLRLRLVQLPDSNWEDRGRLRLPLRVETGDMLYPTYLGHAFAQAVDTRFGEMVDAHLEVNAS